jgi:hypothetical protein
VLSPGGAGGLMSSQRGIAMSFKDQMLADNAVFFNTGEFGESATYLIKATSVSVTTVVVFSRNESLSSWDAGGQAEFAQAHIQKSAVSKPQRYDTLTIDGETWTVESVMESDSVSHLVRLSRDQRMG